jgi:succinyl-diaminopimelate desuccinylase
MSEYPYRPAEMKCQVVEGGKVELTTEVEGTQHGSGPHENRDYGANPLVSLTNFLTYLVYENHEENGNRGIRLADNSIAKMTQFIRWGWGTQVFGEKHHDLLKRHDEVFEKGNGTTYAITHFKTEKDEVQLDHVDDWNGESGFLPGKISRFGQQGNSCTEDDCLFDKLVKRFNDERKGTTQVEVTTATPFPPEIRDPDTSEEFKKINEAFKAITKQDCPKLAIGGGTDAKGHPELWAAGALFDSKMGPPISYHGQNEGAPIEHLKLGTKILYRFLCNEIEDCKTGPK